MATKRTEAPGGPTPKERLENLSKTLLSVKDEVAKMKGGMQSHQADDVREAAKRLLDDAEADIKVLSTAVEDLD